MRQGMQGSQIEPATVCQGAEGSEIESFRASQRQPEQAEAGSSAGSEDTTASSSITVGAILSGGRAKQNQ